MKLVSVITVSPCFEKCGILWIIGTTDREPSDRTYKIQPPLDIIFNNIQDLYLPGDTVVIDESNVAI